MTDDTMLPFSFPAVHAKKVTAAFDGGRLTSNGGVMLLAMAERRLGLADNLARVFPDRRDPTRVVHSLVDMFRARMFAICCGYEDADDLDRLRSDPAFKLACSRLPDTGRDLCSQPTISRWENAPSLRLFAGPSRAGLETVPVLADRTLPAPYPPYKMICPAAQRPPGSSSQWTPSWSK